MIEKLQELEARFGVYLYAVVHADGSGSLFDFDGDAELFVFTSVEELDSWVPDWGWEIKPGEEVILINGWRVYVYPGEFEYLGVYNVGWGIYYPMTVNEQDIDWRASRNDRASRESA